MTRRSSSTQTNRQILEAIYQQGVQNMATLDNLSAAIDQLGTDIATEASDATAAFAALQASIAALSVGAITQAQIDDLTAKATAADAAVQAIDTAAKTATPAP